MADDNDADYESTSRRNIWSPIYIKKFSKLLLDNKVVLQNLYSRGFVKEDPMHQLKKCALEHLREQLGMTSIDQVEKRINSFKELALSRYRQCADKCSSKATPETILRSTPRWLQELEPHLNLWKLVGRDEQSTDTATTTTATKATPGPAIGRGTQLALSLAQAARAARSLEARAVLGKIKNIPQGKKDEVQCIWYRMLDVVRQKLTILRDSGVSADQMQGARFTPVESMLAELVLLYDDNVCTVSGSGDYDSMQVLVELFHLAQLHRLEDELAGPERWRRAHRAYKARSVNISGLCSALILIQRRWHELKMATRAAFTSYCRPPPGADIKPPSPLYAAIAKRFPLVLTAPLLSWRELVNNGHIVEEDDDEQSQHLTDEIPPDQHDIEGINLLSARELACYKQSAQDDEDDLILIEDEIETIDLIDDRKNNSNNQTQSAVVDNVILQNQLQNKRKNFTDLLAMELDKQLKDIEMDNESDIELLSQTEPQGAPTFIYESDGSDIECTEDRNRNIEMIVSQINNEDSQTIPLAADNSVDLIATKIKKEIVKKVNCDQSTDGDKSGDGEGKGDDDSDADDCVEIDSKLLMDARINLFKVNETPEWQKYVKRNTTIDITKLDLSLFEPKLAEVQGDSARTDLVQAAINGPDMVVQIKPEKMEFDSPSGKPTGERQVKSMAKRLISEIMREECEGTDISSRSRACVRKVRRLMDNVDDASNRVTKKVQLPNIDEVRKNNKCMLTAQVAPLSTDESADPEDKNTDVPTPSSPTDSNDRLEIDEGAERRQDQDIIFSQSELLNVLKRISTEACVFQRSGLAQNQRAGDGPYATVHCCTARRQRAVNAARTRVAARAARPPPPFIDIHSASACARMKRCVCCCSHLLQAGEATKKLFQEAMDIDTALNRLWDDDNTENSESDAPEIVDNETSNSSTGKPSTTKRSKKKTEPEPNPEESNEINLIKDPLAEWNRQKTLNQQYFNLNLKPQQAKPPNYRKFHLISKDNPNAPPRVVYAQPNVEKNNYKVLEMNDNGKLVDFPVTVAKNLTTANNDQQPDNSHFLNSVVSGQLQTKNVQPGSIPSNDQPDNDSNFSMFSVVSGQLQTKNVQPGNKPSNYQPGNDSNFSVVSDVSGQLHSNNQPGNNQPGNYCIASDQPLCNNVQPKTTSNDQPDTESSFIVSSVVSGQLQADNVAPGRGNKVTVPSISLLKNTPTKSIHTSFNLVTETKNNTKIVTLNKANGATSESQSVVPMSFKVTATNQDTVKVVPVKQIKLSEFFPKESAKSQHVEKKVPELRGTGMKVLKISSGSPKQVLKNSSEPGVPTTRPYIMITKLPTPGKGIRRVLPKLAPRPTTVNVSSQNPPQLSPPTTPDDVPQNTSIPHPPTIKTQIMLPSKGNLPNVYVSTPAPITPTAADTISSPPKRLISIDATDKEPQKLILNISPSKDGAGSQRTARFKIVSATPSRVINGSSFIGKQVINKLAGERAFTSPLLSDGAVLTNVTREKNMSVGRLAPVTTKSTAVTNTGDVVVFTNATRENNTNVGRLAPATSKPTAVTNTGDVAVLTRENNTSVGRLAPATSKPTAVTNTAVAAPPVSLLRKVPMAEIIQKHFKQSRESMAVDSFISDKDPSSILMVCMDPEGPLLILANEFYILTDVDLNFANPEYWTIGNLYKSRRILIKSSKDDPKPSTSNGSEVLSSPEKMCQANKTYIKLKDEPLIYARALYAVRTGQEAQNLLMRYSSLQIISARTGAISPLSKNDTLGKNRLALTCPMLEAAKALALILNELPAADLGGAEPVPARAGANARADVVMMMNNVNRKPIEMVYIDSDEEVEVKDFKGLENFENLEDFEL